MNKLKFAQWILALLVLLVFAGASGAAEVVLHPGYITGTVSNNTEGYTARNISLSSSGGGFSATKSVPGADYSLTVQAGEWEHTVNASATISPSGASYPYTNVTFSPRTIAVDEGVTVENNYAATGNVRFNVQITGDSYSNWRGYGYATKSASTEYEKTQSNSYTGYKYSDASWDMQVVPNSQIRLYAYVYVRSTYGSVTYRFFYDADDLLYKDITNGETVVLNLNINHVAPPQPPPQPPTVYDTGTVESNIFLDLNIDGTSYEDRFNYHYAPYLSSVAANPGFVSRTLRTRNYSIRPRTYFKDNFNSSYFLYWPYQDGDSQNSLVTVLKDQTTVKDFNQVAGRVAGQVKFTGTLPNDKINYFTLTYIGVSQIYNSETNSWERQPTYGGQSYRSFHSVNYPDGAFDYFLTPGPWNSSGISVRSYGSDKGYYSNSEFSITDYNYHYDGNHYNFGSPTYVVAGATTNVEREYCTGTAVVRFRVNGGGLLSYPYMRGYGRSFRTDGKQEMYVTNRGSSNANMIEAPEVEIHGPGMDYYMHEIRVYAEDGSRITFTPMPLTLECGVKKIFDISAPVLSVTSPTPYLITNAASLTVSGTASDADITAITVNGGAAAYASSNNQDDPNEVAFDYELSLAEGENLITTSATDGNGNEAADERIVYVDRWVPTVSFVTPTDGQFFLPGSEVPVSLSSTDRGYGFSLKVYLDGVLLYETDHDPADDQGWEEVLYSGNVTATADDQVLSAVATDKAGNSTTTTLTIRGNSPPVCDPIGPFSVNEGGEVVLSATATDAEGSVLSYAWDLDNDGTFETTGQSITVSVADLDGPGTLPVAVQVTDNGGLSDTGSSAVTVVNVAPTADFANTSGNINEGSAATVAFSNQFDPSVADVTFGLTYAYDCNSDGTFELVDSAQAFYACQYDDNGSYLVTGMIADKDGGVSQYQVSVEVANVAPTADLSNTAGGIFEGSSVQIAFGSQADASSADVAAGFTYAYDCNSDGDFDLVDSTDTNYVCQYPDNGAFTATGIITDKDGGASSFTAAVAVANVDPAVGEINASLDPFEVGAVFSGSADFTDPGVFDTHTATWNWGDGTSSAGVVNEQSGSGSVTGSHAYATAGVYTVTLTVTDKDGGSGNSEFSYAVIYDPGSGFVTGGGWIDSPAGAYVADPGLTGKANFGFVSKYKKGASVPTGQTEFNYRVADFNFHSTSYEWLVVAGSKAKYKGFGTVNGEGEYRFMLSAIDGKDVGDTDRFWMKIWDKGTGAVVYDNHSGAADDADADQEIGGGNIVVHKK